MEKKVTDAREVLAHIIDREELMEAYKVRRQAEEKIKALREHHFESIKTYLEEHPDEILLLGDIEEATGLNRTGWRPVPPYGLEFRRVPITKYMAEVDQNGRVIGKVKGHQVKRVGLTKLEERVRGR